MGVREVAGSLIRRAAVTGPFRGRAPGHVFEPRHSPSIRTPLSRCCLALAFALGAQPLPAQQPWSVEPGQRVRISSGGEQGGFVVQAVGSGELMLAEVGSDRTVRMPTASISRLDVSRGPRSRSAGFGRGFAFGFIGGALVGSVLGLASGDGGCGGSGGWVSYCIQFSAGERALIGGGVLGALGGLTGGLIGATRPGERWQRIGRQTQWTLVPGRNGGLAVVASLRR